MRGRTLAEKNFGRGFRDRMLQFVVRVIPTCQVEGCRGRTAGILLLYVDAHPPGRDWYAKLVRSIAVGAETEVGLCEAHVVAVVERDEEMMMNPDLWEPGRENPPVMPGPGRLIRSA